MNRSNHSILFLIALLCRLDGAVAADWPQWRGPDRDGVSRETGWLDRWPANGPAMAWKAQAGLGFSSFVTSQNRVYTTGHADETDTIFCWDAATGKEIWRHSYPAELGDKFFEGGTTGTPTLDGDRLFALSRWGDVFCLDAATGRVIWGRNVQKETEVRVPGWGFSGAPLVQGDLLILNVGEAGMAIEKSTGKLVWQSANKDAGYSTPLPVARDGREFGIIGSAQAYVAVDLRTGKEAWRIRWLTQYGVNAADPILSDGHVFISTGYGKGAALFRWSGAEPETEPVWKSKVLRTQMNPAVLWGGHLYGVDGDTTAKASLKCVEFTTGTEKWNQPDIGSGSVMVVDGRLIVLSARGELMVAPASPEGFKPTARSQVLGGKCWTVPVLSNGRIYCRNARGDVVCVDVRGATAASP